MRASQTSAAVGAFDAELCAGADPAESLQHSAKAVKARIASRDVKTDMLGVVLEGLGVTATVFRESRFAG